MSLASEDTITFDVGKRLEELFGLAQEKDELGREAKTREYAFLFERLNGIVECIDEELTDYLTGKFRDCIESLKDATREDKVLFMFVRLVNSVGEYIAANGLQRDDEALGLLTDFSRRACEAAFSNSLSLKDKKRILYNEIMRYKHFKDKGKNSDDSSPLGKAEVEEETISERTNGNEFEYLEQMTPHEAFTVALAEIKNILQAEFRALRTELALWRKGQ